MELKSLSLSRSCAIAGDTVGGLLRTAFHFSRSAAESSDIAQDQRRCDGDGDQSLLSHPPSNIVDYVRTDRGSRDLEISFLMGYA